jgi:signal transduction histidine kinase/CheY-like chemotaxis protein
MFSASIAVFLPDDRTRLQPVVRLTGGKPSPRPFRAFPAQELFARERLQNAGRQTLLVFPLVLSARCLGVAVFEYVPGTNGYVIIRDRVSVAIGSVEMHQQIVQQTMVHQRKIQEQQRLANEDRIRGLNVLAGGVAHDLNNALGPMVALPDVLLEELGGLLEEGQLCAAERSADSAARARNLRTDLESIKASALRASQTIKDLLTMSRQNRVTREPLELNQCLRRFLADLVHQSTWPREQFTVETDWHRAPLWLLGSETHLQRALSNLLFNALDASEGRGRVWIRTGQRRVGDEEAAREGVREGVFATLEVADEGHGISEADLPRIFEPFFSSKRMNGRSGSGLGLAIVQGVTEGHGGFIQLRSTPGSGTCFTLHFPLDAEPARVESVASPLSVRRSGRILVVDDDPVQLRTATRVLRHFGYTVDAENSGLSARARFSLGDGGQGTLERSPYDLLILDMQLNEAEDGVQLFRRILARFPEQRAILSSGHAVPEAGVPSAPAGLGWLPKPYTAESLAAAVSEALEGRPPRAFSLGGRLLSDEA